MQNLYPKTYYSFQKRNTRNNTTVFNDIFRIYNFAAGLGSSTVDQVLKYTKYPKYIPSTSTGQVLIFFKKYLSASSTFISSTSTSTSTHLKICSKVSMDIQSRVKFWMDKIKGLSPNHVCSSQDGNILCRVDFGWTN